MRNWIIVAVALMSIAVASQATSRNSVRQPVCTPDHPVARQEALSLLDAPELATRLAELGLAGVAPSEVRVLEGRADSRHCAQLQKRIPEAFRVEGAKSPWIATYYRVRDRYVVPVIERYDPDAETFELEYGRTLVFDLEYRLLESFLN